jgi:hypothetical protein
MTLAGRAVAIIILGTSVMPACGHAESKDPDAEGGIADAGASADVHAGGYPDGPDACGTAASFTCGTVTCKRPRPGVPGEICVDTPNRSGEWFCEALPDECLDTPTCDCYLKDPFHHDTCTERCPGALQTIDHHG